VAERLAQEDAFFRHPSWREVANSGRCGIGSLNCFLGNLLNTIIKKEFPQVKADVSKQLDKYRRELESMGLSRTEHSAQRIYLGRLGARFQAITQCALNGYYDSEALFTDEPTLKLITAVTAINEQFANIFWRRGHKRHTSPQWNDEGEAVHTLAEKDESNLARELFLPYPELHDIIEIDEYVCPRPKGFYDDCVMDHIETVYRLNRGPELGTVRKPDCFESASTNIATT
jgi:hypothetical protein